jgi:hypothetical protein
MRWLPGGDSLLSLPAEDPGRSQPHPPLGPAQDQPQPERWLSKAEVKVEVEVEGNAMASRRRPSTVAPCGGTRLVSTSSSPGPGAGPTSASALAEQG